MSDASPREPRLDETPEQTTRQIQAADWNRAEIEAVPAPSPRRERLFSRKVMIGWALFAIAAYFGVQAAKTAVKASVRQAVESGTLRSATRTQDGVVIQTRNGTRIRIGGDRPRGPSIIVTPGAPAKSIPPVTPAPSATGAATAPAAAPAISPEPKKR